MTTINAVFNTGATDIPLAQSLGKSMPELRHANEIERAPLAKLASNENPLGPSPQVLNLLAQSGALVARYPDPGGFELRNALAQQHGLNPDQVVLGNGSSEILALLAHAFLSTGTSAVYTQYAFLVYPIITRAAGARGIEVRARDFGNDPQALLNAIAEDTRIIFVANPNNPTGTLLARDQLLAFIEQIPPRVLLVLDEAYYEYLLDAAASRSVEWLDKFPNLIIVRTFSKAYGLAGLRIGYALAHLSVSSLINRIRQPFNVNSFAQAAALEALADRPHLARSVALTQAGIQQISRGLKKLGIEYIQTYGNFITFRVGNALHIQRGLLDLGVFVRELDNYGLPEYLRVSIGTANENDRFLQALEKLSPAVAST